MTNRFPIFSGKCVVAQVCLYRILLHIRFSLSSLASEHLVHPGCIEELNIACGCLWKEILRQYVELHGQMFTKDREGNTVLSLCNRLARRKVLQSSFRLLTY